MRRNAGTARCALIKCNRAWEACVLVENKILLNEACDSLEEAFGLASEWQSRLRADGWQPIAPASRL
jgi:hypothetical protein